MHFVYIDFYISLHLDFFKLYLEYAKFMSNID